MIYNMKSINPILLLVTFLFEMIFIHVLVDFNLQGKRWWIDTIEDLYNDKYKYEYRTALLIHSFMWSFMIHILFLFLYTPNYKIFLSIIINTILHYIIDDQAKELENSISAQIFHLEQICLTVIILAVSNAIPI